LIREAVPGDAGQIAAIYNYYIEHTVITFEETILDESVMRNRIIETTKKYPWLVREENGVVMGYAYAHQWRERESYRFSVEDSVYVKNGAQSRGIGSSLLQRLIDNLRERGAHAVVAGITLPNEQSARLHEKFNFVKAGEFREIGFKNNRWLAVGFWELLL
jgi:phosphinothricin acetyltransferase